MSALRIEEPEEVDVVYFRVPVDVKTVAWIMEIAEAAHAPPDKVMAAILRDVRRDDQLAELSQPPAPIEQILLN